MLSTSRCLRSREGRLAVTSVLCLTGGMGTVRLGVQPAAWLGWDTALAIDGSDGCGRAVSAVVQTAQPHEFAAIAALNVESYREFAGAVGPEAWAAMQGNLSNVAGVAERATFLVASVGGVLAGSVAYCSAGRSVDPIPSEWASILLLAVSPRRRGQGVGAQLIDTCLDLARTDGASVVGLLTSELMTSAQRLYEGVGFQRECEIRRRHGLRYFRYRLELAVGR